MGVSGAPLDTWPITMGRDVTMGGMCCPMALESFEKCPRVMELVRNLDEVCQRFQPHLIPSPLLFYLLTHSVLDCGPRILQPFHSQASVLSPSLQHLLLAGCLFLLIFLTSVQIYSPQMSTPNFQRRYLFSIPSPLNNFLQGFHHNN